MQFSNILHWDWYYTFTFFMAERDKQQSTSYKLTIWYQYYHHYIMRDIWSLIQSTINSCLSLRSCPKERMIYPILSLHCLHVIPMFTNCEIQLDGNLNPHFTKLQISEWSTFDCGMKHSRIEPKEISTCWWSNMYRSETAFCHKIFSWWPGNGSWNA